MRAVPTARRASFGAACAAIALLLGCGDDAPIEPAPDPQGWEWDLPEGFPVPRVPTDNPMTRAKVELGRHLFYDTRLSENETQSCGTCHVQELAFTDGLARAEGSLGDVHPRGAMALGNVAYQATLTWASPVVRRLEDQALLPLFGEEPIVELGMAGEEELLLSRLRADADYARMFADAFPTEADPITVANVARALAAFQRSLVSGSSRYDRYVRDGETDAMSESALRGAELFFGERLDCFRCHGGANFAAPVDRTGAVFDEPAFFNNGLYDIDGRGGYPPDNTGLHASTGRATDMGRFKPPTLRNVAVTAPYMHDGSIATLEEVIATYAAGGRNVTEGPWVGDGRESPNKSPFVHGFEATPEELADVLEFLRSLTDDAFLTDPRFADPFASD